MSESEMLRAFKESRSEAAFAQLVRRYAGLVYSVARRRLANASLAEDITQLVFIRLARTPPKVESHAELAAWLHRTTVNVTIDVWRSETRRRARELQSVVMEPASPETAIWEQISPELDEALNQLNDEDRQALLLRYFGQKAMREVGAALGVSEDAAKMRVSRALDRLRTQLGVNSVVCTAAVLGTMLAERSLEAVPVPLLFQLAAIKLPAAAGATGLAGLFEALLHSSKFKLAAGAVALALVATVAIHFVRPVKPSIPATTEVTAPQTKLSKYPSENADDRQFEAYVRANQFQADSASGSSNIHIHVLDMETGRPIVGAQILAVCFSRSLHTSTNIYLFTDSRGTVVIPGFLRQTPVTGVEMDAIAQGYIPKGIDPWGYHNRRIPSDYTIKLEPAMTVSGIVEDEDGQPVPGVRIMEEAPGSLGAPGQMILFQYVTNNSDGSWSYTYVPRYMTNQIPFLLTKDGYATTFIVVPVSQVDLNHLVFVMNKGYTITGRVTDTQQQPIPKACVKTLPFCFAVEPGSPQSVWTDPDGTFILSNVRGGNTEDLTQKSTIVTNSNGELASVPYCSRTATLVTNEYGVVSLRDSAQDLPLQVQADGFVPETNLMHLTETTNVVNFTLSPGHILRGRVLDEAGNPVTNAVVRTPWSRVGVAAIVFGVEWQTRTDANGQFEWDSAPADPILFNFNADGYQPKYLVSLVADGTDHDITLERKATP